MQRYTSSARKYKVETVFFVLAHLCGQFYIFPEGVANPASAMLGVNEVDVSLKGGYRKLPQAMEAKLIRDHLHKEGVSVTPGVNLVQGKA